MVHIMNCFFFVFGYQPLSWCASQKVNIKQTESYVFVPKLLYPELNESGLTLGTRLWLYSVVSCFFFSALFDLPNSVGHVCLFICGFPKTPADQAHQCVIKMRPGLQMAPYDQMTRFCVSSPIKLPSPHICWLRLILNWPSRVEPPHLSHSYTFHPLVTETIMFCLHPSRVSSQLDSSPKNACAFGHKGCMCFRPFPGGTLWLAVEETVQF